MESYVEKVNEIIGRNLAVRTYFLKREEALSMPGIVKLAQAAPPEASELRIVEIGDFDRQADGGVHVSRTSEIGKVKFLRADNKGRSNRRVYFALE
jgi:misacylated tRNA(Ala) deacylase